MKQETFNSLIRSILTLAGAFLIGGGVKFFGIEIDTAYWQEIAGSVITLLSIGWGLSTHSLPIEKLETGVRQILTFGLGILVARGVLSPEKSLAILTFVLGLLPFIQSYLSKKKAEQLQDGKIVPQQLVTKNTK